MHVRVSDWDVVGGRMFVKFGVVWCEEVRQRCAGQCFICCSRNEKGKSDMHQIGKALATSEQQT